MSLSELPAELLRQIGSYLPKWLRAWLCLQDQRLYSALGSQFCDNKEIVSEVLLWAAEAGDIKMMKSELKHRPNVDCAARGRTPLFFAAQRGDAAMTELLLKPEYRPNVDRADLHGRTPLLLAVQRGDVEITRLLLQAQDVKKYRADADGISPLVWASRKGHAMVVDLLVAADTGRDLNYLDALSAAKDYEQTEVLEKLLLIAKEKDERFCEQLLSESPGRRDSMNGIIKL